MILAPSLSVFCNLCWKHGKRDDCSDKTCCLAGVYERNPNPTIEDIIQTCCAGRCMHGGDYHLNHCPISLAGINLKYPLNPRLIAKSKSTLDYWSKQS